VNNRVETRYTRRYTPDSNEVSNREPSDMLAISAPAAREAALTIESTLTRRLALLSPIALGAACTSLPSGPPADDVFRNIATPSESVHSGVASLDGERRLTVRLCRYPDLGLAWIWVHARTPAGFFSHVEHLAPCGRDATPVESENVTYADAGRRIVFVRNGPVTKPAGAKVTGACKAHRSTQSRLGDGANKLEFAIDFTPARLYSGLNAGRTEVFGRSRASVTVNGERFDIEGPAQFHEQRQTNPRFTQPFAYGTLWGEDAASTLLVTANRRDGYLLEGDKAEEIETIQLGHPGQRRALSLHLAGGRTLEGAATLVQAYTIPIVGNVWRGHMIQAELGGRSYFGHINDYLSDAVPYSD
jgi:hypothetical protein